MGRVITRVVVSAAVLAAPLAVSAAPAAAAVPGADVAIFGAQASDDGKSIDVTLVTAANGKEGNPDPKTSCAVTATPVNAGSTSASASALVPPTTGQNNYFALFGTTVRPETSNTYGITASCTYAGDTFSISTVDGKPLTVTLTGLPAPTPTPNPTPTPAPANPFHFGSS